MSYTNLIMYGAVIPSPKSFKDRNKGDKDKNGDVIRDTDPDYKEKLRKFLDSYND